MQTMPIASLFGAPRIKVDNPMASWKKNPRTCDKRREVKYTHYPCLELVVEKAALMIHRLGRGHVLIELVRGRRSTSGDTICRTSASVLESHV